jgi:hypothetical protein
LEAQSPIRASSQQLPVSYSVDIGVCSANPLNFIDNTGSFTWTPSISIEPRGDYALMIVSDEDDHVVDYSPRFSIDRYVIDRRALASSFASAGRLSFQQRPRILFHSRISGR